MISGVQLQSRELIPAGEFPFRQGDYDRIARRLHDESGIFLGDAKAPLVYSRLAKRLRALGLEAFDQYCALIESPDGVDELGAMIAALTTNVTRFYREPHHFSDLGTQLELIADAVRDGARLRLWSAACSSGQEPFSMALTVLSVLPEAPQLDVRILASDIDPVILDRARTGVYSREEVEPVPPELRSRWMRQSGDAFEIGDEARALVAFRKLNLIGPWPMSGAFDFIFCRNVAIYFDEPTQETLWRRFAGVMTPHGRLYIGHSERVPDHLGLFASDGLTAYRPLSGGEG